MILGFTVQACTEGKEFEPSAWQQHEPGEYSCRDTDLPVSSAIVKVQKEYLKATPYREVMVPPLG